MPDKKITDLTSLTGAGTASGDLFPIVDISDTTMGATGTDKKITRDELNIALGILPPTQQILTSTTSATYTTPAGCTGILVQMVGGGGAGGGAAGALSNAAAGGGGASGAYARKYISSPSATYTYSCGAGGTAGTAGNNAGNNGGTTTFGTMTAGGGAGGTGMAAGTTVSLVRGGLESTGTANADFSTTGQDGSEGWRLSASANLAGKGGASYFGAGARAQDGNGTGITATSPGSGGAGGCTSNNATSRSGGAGANGVILVTEYYG